MNPRPQTPPSTPLSTPPAALTLALLAALPLALTSCTPEEKVTRYKPFFTGIENARFNEQPVLGDPRVTPVSPETGTENKIVIESPDGKKTLISRAPLHVMQHVERCLDENEDDLLLDQIIASQTKDYYRAQGKDPRQYVELLRSRRKDIAKLFARLPQGENSPTALLRQLPDRTWRVDLVGGYAKDLTWTRLWVQMERGQWKLLWID